MRIFCTLLALWLTSQTSLVAQPVDVTYVPEGSLGAIVIHPRQVLTRDVVKLYPTEVLTALSLEQTSIDPVQVDQALIVFLPTVGEPVPFKPVIIIRFSESTALERFKDGMIREEHKERRLQGKTAYIYDTEGGPEPPFGSFVFPDEKTVLMATEANLDAMLRAKANDDPLIQRLKQIDHSTDGVAVASIKPLRLFLPLLNQVPIPPAFEKYKQIPKLLDTIQLQVQLEAVQKLELSLIANDEAAAGELETLLKDAVTDAQQMGAPMLLRDMKLQDDPELATAAKTYFDRLAKLGHEHLVPKREGDKLVLRLEGRGGLKELGLAVGATLPTLMEERQWQYPPTLSSAEQMKYILLAMHNFASIDNNLPVDGPGKEPNLSWRIHILPMLEESFLRDQIDTEQKWDSEVNKEVIDLMPDIYLAADSELDLFDGKTSYVMPTGKGLAKDPARPGPLRFRDFRDGSSNTILVIEVEDYLAVPWTKPGDLNIDLANPKKIFEKDSDGKIVVGMADGSVHTLDLNKISNEQFKALLTIAGGEAIDTFEILER